MKSVRLFFSLGLLFCFHSGIFAQNEDNNLRGFSGIKIYSETIKKVPDSILHSYQVFEIDSWAIKEFLNSRNGLFNLDIKLGNDFDWNLTLQKKQYTIQADNINIVKLDNIEKTALCNPIICKGFLSNNKMNSEVRLTFDEGFIYGFVSCGDSTYFIQPLRQFIKGTSKDKFIVYEITQAPFPKGARCGVFDSKGNTKPLIDTIQENKKSKGTVQQQLLYYTAVDYSIYQAFDYSVQDIYNTLSGIINLVESNFDNEFNDPFSVEGPYPNSFYISTCSTCDPWTSSANADDLLEDFRDWGNNNTLCRDNGKLMQLWTARDIFGIDPNTGNMIMGVIGMAYYGTTICTDDRYQLLEYFSPIADYLRFNVTHETGHNFNCLHDYELDVISDCALAVPSYIMAPYMNSSNTWSSGIYLYDCDKNSTSTINNYYPNVNCLSEFFPYPLKAYDKYVDFSNANCYQTGSMYSHISTVFLSYLRVGLNSTIYINPGVTSEKIIISDPCIIKRYGNTGSVVIGQH
jgi:hypothetical protein